MSIKNKKLKILSLNLGCNKCCTVYSLVHQWNKEWNGRELTWFKRDVRRHTFCFYLLNICVSLFERQSDTEKGKIRDLPCVVLLPKWLQQLHLGCSEARSLEPLLGLPWGCRAQACRQGAGSEAEHVGLELVLTIGRGLTYCTTLPEPLFTIFILTIFLYF